MAGNAIGGRKAAAKNLAKDPNFYANIGAKGGRNGVTGGFASQVVGEDGLTGAERARIAGANGGRISRRRKAAANTDVAA
jgi:general stress protein YciG